MQTPIFVYGSLRKGFQNNYKLDSADFKGEYRTTGKYYMIGTNSGAYPYVTSEHIHETLLPTFICGELYNVSKELLDSLDEMEGHPLHYKRQGVDIENAIGEKVHAQMYVLISEELKTGIRNGFEKRFIGINSGDWRKYKS